jgi:uncharacterized protein YndB with AHSA1/START domain
MAPTVPCAAVAAHSRGSVSVERLIAAPAARIFDVLADPTQHPVIDGSGMVREARAERPSRLSPGATFGMSMRMGVAYAGDGQDAGAARRARHARVLKPPPGPVRPRVQLVVSEG